MKKTSSLPWPKHERSLALVSLLALLLTVCAQIRGQEADRNLFDCREIIVIRHADRDGENLNKGGKERAEALRELLKDRGITKIVVSHLQRTKDTAAPLRNALGPKCAYIELAERDLSAQAVLRFVNKIAEAGDVLLIVSHSDVIPEFLALLPGVQRPADTPFGDMYVLTPSHGKFLQTNEHYGR